MAPAKIPSEAAIVKELQKTVTLIYEGPNSDQLSVNYVRQMVTEKLKLDDNYLKDGDWKARSKQIIHEALGELEKKQPGSSQVSAPSPEVPKQKPKPQPRKRRAKKSPTPESEPEASEDDASDAEVSSEPPTKKRKASQASKSKKAVSDDEEDFDDATPEPEVTKPTKSRVSAKAASVKDKVVSDDDEDMEDAGTEEDKPTKPAPKSDVKPTVEKEDESEVGDSIEVKIYEPPKRKHQAKGKDSGSNTTKENEEAAADSDSSLSSVVVDDGPAPKRKRKSKDSAPAKKPAVPRKPKAAPAELSPDDALVKQLQGQLLKCGVRKVWAFEFKKHDATTPKEKIKHLKQMLTDIGMTGRFSEARAKEIKERRELLDDLGAVQEWNSTFGLDKRASRRRGTKSSSKTLAQSDEDEEDDDNTGVKNENDDSDDENTAAKRNTTRGPPKHRAALAFLDDESESD
ncbi:hypothetical protein QBC38DRAFT_548923 [Podospora fimiseda]|uniref:Transcriptional regulator n=1 Tax=Podospora fimiseda TaxID=252190 RepID=A0AAN6YTI0_9PEZI|nr:hypothetical protein QBC38DRAFT_548923 [Podospora fimiseda]